MTDWSNETILKFLEFYAEERVIWDYRDKNHKFKHKVREAWKRISANMGNMTVNELKQKKRSLMATFRPLMKKKKASIRSGAEAEDVFQPIWFAFDLMESFLGPIYDYDPEETIDADKEIQLSEAVLPSPLVQQSDEIHHQRMKAITSYHQPPSPTITLSTNHHQPSPSRTQENNNTEPHQKFNVGRKKSHSHSEEASSKRIKVLKRIRREEDECDLYGKLLAMKLRRYPERVRHIMMHKIDGLFLDSPPELEQRPSSSCSNHSSQSIPSTSETRPLQLLCPKIEPEVVLGNTYGYL